MLSQFNKKELEEMAKRMRATTNSPKESSKMKALLIAPDPIDEEEITSGLVFKRKRKILTAPTEHSYSVGRVPSYHVASSGGQTTL